MESKNRKLTIIETSILLFTLTCGGPFGIEAGNVYSFLCIFMSYIIIVIIECSFIAVASGGVGWTLLGLILVPFFYSLPQSLMCAELGSMMPSHHGYIAWTFRAFMNDKCGTFIGFYNSIGSLISMGKDIPIYIVLMVYYFKQLILTDFDVKLKFWEEYLLKLSFIIIGGLLNIANITAIGKTSILFAIIIVLPFIIGFFASLKYFDINNLTDNRPQNNNNEYQWGLFIATIMWLHTGWDSLGSLTAELGFNRSKLFLCFIFAMVMDYFVYTISIIGAASIKCDNDCWDDGYLFVAFNDVLPKLGLWVVISGFVSNFSLYVSEMAVQSRVMWALSQPYLILLKDGTMLVDGHDGIYDENMNKVDISRSSIKGKRIRIGILPVWLSGTIWNRTGSPVKGVLLQSLISCILVIFDIEVLLQAMVVIACTTWAIELISFLRLRYTEPDTFRPFKAPGGLFVAWLITIDKVIIVTILLVFVIKDNPNFLWVSAATLMITIIWYIIWKKYCFHKFMDHFETLNDTNDNSDVEMIQKHE